jgi:hypothetical protein
MQQRNALQLRNASDAKFAQYPSSPEQSLICGNHGRS